MTDIGTRQKAAAAISAQPAVIENHHGAACIKWPLGRQFASMNGLGDGHDAQRAITGLTHPTALKAQSARDLKPARERPTASRPRGAARTDGDFSHACRTGWDH
jgi:hypothetical protein